MKFVLLLLIVLTSMSGRAEWVIEEVEQSNTTDNVCPKINGGDVVWISTDHNQSDTTWSFTGTVVKNGQTFSNPANGRVCTDSLQISDQGISYHSRINEDLQTYTNGRVGLYLNDSLIIETPSWLNQQPVSGMRIGYEHQNNGPVIGAIFWDLKFEEETRTCDFHLWSADDGSSDSTHLFRYGWEDFGGFTAYETAQPKLVGIKGDTYYLLVSNSLRWALCSYKNLGNPVQIDSGNDWPPFLFDFDTMGDQFVFCVSRPDNLEVYVGDDSGEFVKLSNEFRAVYPTINQGNVAWFGSVGDPYTHAILARIDGQMVEPIPLQYQFGGAGGGIDIYDRTVVWSETNANDRWVVRKATYQPPARIDDWTHF